MNYAVVILAFVMSVALVYWYIHGRTYYTGPRITARVINGAIVAREETDSAHDQEKAAVPLPELET